MIHQGDQFRRNVLHTEGRAWFRSALSPLVLSQLDDLVPIDSRRPGRRISVRNAPAEAIQSLNVLARGILPNAQPVRMVAFNKTAANSWAVPWHQDRVIAVKERANVESYDNWTRQSDYWHARPPIDFLQRMLFLRVYLDDTSTDAGELEIALGSHLKGAIAAEEVARTASTLAKETATGRRGDVLAAKALILHRSSGSRTPDNRRALRIDYSADQLPKPLQWAETE